MIGRDAFVAGRERSWRLLEAQLAALEAGKPAARVAELPALYRRVAQHLALVRARCYGGDLETRLHELVLRGHQQLYQQRAQRSRWLVELLRWRLPRLVRAEARLLALCSALLVVPMLAMGAAVHRQPGLVYSVLAPAEVRQFEEMYAGAAAEGEPRTAADDVGMLGFYVYNNVGLAFRTFATGLFLGVGVLAALLWNGAYFGAVGGYLVGAGHATRFFSFVAGHAAFELTGIVLSGVAGLRLGLSVLAPGARTRTRALREEGSRLVPMVWGVFALLLLAACVEAFWSPRELPAAVRYAAGALAWAAVAAYFALAGRSDAA